MKKRKPAAKAGAPSARQRRAELEAVSGVERLKAAPGQPAKTGRAASRGVVIYLNPIAKEALDQLSLQKKKSLQKLGLEAFNHLFRAYGKNPIA